MYINDSQFGEANTIASKLNSDPNLKDWGKRAVEFDLPVIQTEKDGVQFEKTIIVSDLVKFLEFISRHDLVDEFVVPFIFRELQRSIFEQNGIPLLFRQTAVATNFRQAGLILIHSTNSTNEMRSIGYTALGLNLQEGNFVWDKGGRMSQRTLYVKAIALNPNNSVAYSLLGQQMTLSERIAIDGKELTKKELFIESIRLNANNPSPYYLLGDLLSGKENVTLHDGRSIDKRGLFDLGMQKGLYYPLTSSSEQDHLQTRFGQWTDFHIVLNTDIPRKDIQIVLPDSLLSNLYLEIRSLRIKGKNVSGMFRVFWLHPKWRDVDFSNEDDIAFAFFPKTDGLFLELVAICGSMECERYDYFQVQTSDNGNEVGRSEQYFIQSHSINFLVIPDKLTYIHQIRNTHPVMAYHFNERAKKLANLSIMSQISQTSSFTVGRCFQKDIHRMRKNGIAVEIQKSSSEFMLSPNVENKKHPFYLIQMTHWTMNKVQLKSLNDGGIELLESMTEDTYLCKITGDLDTTDFGYLVKRIVPYSMELVTPFSGPQDPLLIENQLNVVKLNVQTFEDDSSQVVNWCKDRGLKVFSSGKYLGIEIELDSLNNHFDDLCQLEQVRLVMKSVQPELFCRIAKLELGVEIPKYFRAHSMLLVNSIYNPPIRLHQEIGDGQIIGIADNYLDCNHPAFHGRLRVEYLSQNAFVHHHGTNVAGCALGSGAGALPNDYLDGIAPSARLYFQQLISNDQGQIELPLNEIDLFDRAYKIGVRIHNNSWGFLISNPNFGYDILASKVDRFVVEHPDLLIVVAAGNFGERGDRTIASPGVCKNVLTVGASAGNEVAPDSSRGDCSGRNKPDLLAPGSCTAASPVSTIYGSKQFYSHASGTSMAAGFVSGCAALVREYYMRTRNYQQPTAALLKATLVNGTQGYEPNCRAGFGKVNMAQTIPSSSIPFKLIYFDFPSHQTQLGGADSSWSTSITVLTPKFPLRVCLCWTDNSPGRALGSELSFQVDFNGEPPSCHSSGSIRSNVHKIIIEHPVAGRYSINVCATKVGNLPQDFALIVTGDIET